MPLAKVVTIFLPDSKNQETAPVMISFTPLIPLETASLAAVILVVMPVTILWKSCTTAPGIASSFSFRKPRTALTPSRNHSHLL